jgi:hypothetical protein
LRRFGILLSVLSLAAGCGNKAGEVATLSAIVFAPLPAPMAGGVCSVEATLISDLAYPVTLLTLSARFEDGQGNVARLQGPVENYGVPVGGGIVAANSAATVPIVLDLSGQGLTAPVTGDIVLTGVFDLGAATFAGSITCI